MIIQVIGFAPIKTWTCLIDKFLKISLQSSTVETNQDEMILFIEHISVLPSWTFFKKPINQT